MKYYDWKKKFIDLNSTKLLINLPFEESQIARRTKKIESMFLILESFEYFTYNFEGFEISAIPEFEAIIISNFKYDNHYDNNADYIDFHRELQDCISDNSCMPFINFSTTEKGDRFLLQFRNSEQRDYFVSRIDGEQSRFSEMDEKQIKEMPLLHSQIAGARIIDNQEKFLAMHSLETKDTLTIFCNPKIGFNLTKYIPTLFAETIIYIPNKIIGLSISLAFSSALTTQERGRTRHVDPDIVCLKAATIFCSLKQTLPNELIKEIEGYCHRHPIR